MESDLSSDEEAFLLTSILAPKPEWLELLSRPPEEPASEVVDDGRRGSVKGRRAARWRSTEWVDNLEALDSVQWRKFFRMGRRTVQWLVRRLHARLFRPGRNKRGEFN